MAFVDNLAQLPTIEHLAVLRLTDAQTGANLGEIPNAPGKQGSLRVYAAVARERGGVIDAAAAERALALFAEHTDDARARAGAHPNIDRLFEIVATNRVLRVEFVEKNAV